MNPAHSIHVIAHIHTDFPTKFGIPRQSGLVEELKAQIVFEAPYRNAEAVRGLEDYSHLWLIWEFSQAKRSTWSPTVRPPRLGGNKRVGVFATRSPFRPNSLGLSCVKLDYIEQHPTLGTVIHILGADLMDNTPIYDIKPYLPFVDSHPNAKGGFSEKHKDYQLTVMIPPEYEAVIPTEKLSVLKEILAQDPRPSYQQDRTRVYGFAFADFEVKFTVEESVLRVCSVEIRKG